MKINYWMISTLILAVLFFGILGLYVFSLYQTNQSGSNITPTLPPLASEFACSQDDDCVIGIQATSCCSCPKAINKDLMGIKDWEQYEFGKDYSSLQTKSCKGRVYCQPCEYPAKPICENGTCRFSTQTNIQPTKKETLEPNCCSQDQIEKGYTCMQDCGPPVVNLEEKYDISFSCLSPEQIENRKRFGCPPVCLSSSTKIATPFGEIDVYKLKPGILVWTVNRDGQKVTQPILRVAATTVSKYHKVVHFVLADGRQLWVSPKHPTTDTRTVEELKIGSLYDGSVVTSVELEQYREDKTYDLLPAGETGFYFANSILLDSTLHDKLL